MKRAGEIYNYLSYSRGDFNHPPEIEEALKKARESKNVTEAKWWGLRALCLARRLQVKCGFVSTLVDYALLLSQLEQPGLALEYARMAVEFGSDFGDRAALYWLLGYLHYRQPGHNRAAYAGWREAVGICSEAKERAEINGNEELAAFIGERLEWMQDRLFCTVEESYEKNLNYFGGHVGVSSPSLKEHIERLIGSCQFIQARQALRRFKELGKTAKEAEEVNQNTVFWGLALWQMGSVYEALEHFNEAATRYAAPANHQEAVLHWMMGVIEWEMPGMGGPAAAQWGLACDAFVRLAREAEQKNQPERKNWYAQNGKRMRRLLEDKLSGAPEIP